MLRTHLLAATAVVALISAPAAIAQDAPIPDQTAPETSPVQDVPAQPDPSMLAAPENMSEGALQTAEAAQSDTVVDVLRAQGQFTTLLAALDQAQLTETLSTRPEISIFAPTDAAFAALPDAERTRLMDPANVNELRQVLLYHVIVADVSSDQIEGTRGAVETAARTQVQLDGTGDAIKVDEATVIQADIDASNGAVFAIDRVLNPGASQAAMGDAETAVAEEAPADAPAAAAAPPMDAPPADAATTVETPAPDGLNAPDGNPAATVTTTASPTVPHPTDGQVDGRRPADVPATPPTLPEDETDPNAA